MAETPWDVWLRLRKRFGRRITLMDLYELEALRRGIDAHTLPHDVRDQLKSRWRSVAVPDWKPSPQLTSRHDPIEIVDYDEAWPALFESWRQRLAAALGDKAVSIEHVGSTSVPGLPAKPVIDIQILVPDLANEAAFLPRLESLGVPLHSREQGHVYFRPAAWQPRDVQIHVHGTGSQEAEDRITFRDYLRTSAAAREAYAELKRGLAERFSDDRVAYGEAKTAFILTALDEATRREPN
jgi:GrpB-like predicted nucleotidyltransferase (UPF0157 family)